MTSGRRISCSCVVGDTDEQLDRDFDIGHRTVRATLTHIIRNVEVWSDLMAGHSVRKNEGPNGCSLSALTARLDRAAADLATITRGIAQRGGWDQKLVDTLDNPPTERTYGARSLTPSRTACTIVHNCCTCSAGLGSKTCRKEMFSVGSTKHAITVPEI